MGLILYFLFYPTPSGDCPDNGLATRMYVNVLHRHLLLPLAPIALQGFHLRGVGSHEFNRKS